MLTKKQKRINWVLVAILLVLSIFFLFPVLWMLANSFKPDSAITADMNSIAAFIPPMPDGSFLDNYISILTNTNFVRYMANTLFYAAVLILLGIVVNGLAGYALAKLKVPFKKALIVLLVFNYIVPPQATFIPMAWVFRNLKLVNSPLAFIVPALFGNGLKSSLFILIYMQFFRKIPNELEEAALIDGLGYFGILRRIVLPLSTAAIATIGLYYAVFFWNDWFNSLIYLKSDQYPVMMFLRNIVNGTMVIGTGSGSAEKTTIAISVKSAVIITSTVPIIVIYPFLQKFFVKGLTIGGVKG